MTDPRALAERLRDAYARRSLVPRPSASELDFDLTVAYAVERELVRLRTEAGREPVGVKVGYANKTVWRALKLDTLVWAHMYDDTVRFEQKGGTSVGLERFMAPKIEPEIVVKLRAPLAPGLDAAGALEAVEWIALGFEIIDCVFPEWKFQPADFVAAYGLHAGLVVGPPRSVNPSDIQSLVEVLARFRVKLARNSEVVAEGGGKNSLRSPAACHAELATAIGACAGAKPLAAGALISSGTLTESQPMAAGETWTATIDGLDLAAPTLHFT